MFWGPKHQRYDICVTCLPVWVLVRKVFWCVLWYFKKLFGVYVSLVGGDILFIRKTLLHLGTSCPMIILLPQGEGHSYLHL